MSGRLAEILILLLILTWCPLRGDFKSEQMRQQRVRRAYSLCGDSLQRRLREKNIEMTGLSLYLRVFKREMILEVWARNRGDSGAMVRILEYPVCASSGSIGPKRRQGDLQVPEGFYDIDRFNPWSRFHLSLGLDYPNPSDRILKSGSDPGGDIFIHGSCVTIGCVPITDNYIRELYILCVEAKSGGQQRIPVHVFPARLDGHRYNRLRQTYFNKTGWLQLWEDLKRAYDLFESSRIPPRVRFLADGRHRIS